MRSQFNWPHHNDSEATDLPWSSICKGTRVRWVTPRFVRRGTVISIKRRSMRIQFDGLPNPTVIPDARWYFNEWRHGRIDEHLVTISTPAPEFKQVKPIDEGDTPDRYISTAEAAAILGTDSKTVRRWLRQRRIQGKQDEKHNWIVDRESL